MANQASYSLDTGSVFPGVNLPVPESDRYCPSSAEVMKEWDYTSTPSMCPHDVHKDNYTLTFQLQHWKYQRILKFGQNRSVMYYD